MLSCVGISSQPFILHSHIFHAHVMCKSIWDQASFFFFYTGHTWHLYGVWHDLMSVISPWQFDGPRPAYLGKVHRDLHIFDKETWVVKFLFHVVPFYGLPLVYFINCYQILGSHTVPTLSKAWFTMLQIWPSIPVKLFLPLLLLIFLYLSVKALGNYL